MKKFIVLFIAAMALAITQCKPEVPETPLSPTGEPELVKSTVAKIHGYRTTFIQMRNTNTSTVNLCFDVEYLREGKVICKNHDYYAFYKNYLGPGESWMFYDYYAPLDYDEIKIVNLEYAKTNDAVKMTLVKEEKNIGNLVLGFVTDPTNYVGIQTGMNDCNQILYGNHRLWADDYTEVHNVCRKWLDDALKASTARHKIVLTHHCPTMRKEFDIHQAGSGLYSAFHVDMEPFIARHDIRYWIYGHTHVQDGSGTVFPSKGNGTTLLCNQLGYVELNEDMKGFQNDRIIEL